MSYFLHEGAEEDIAGALTFYTERAGSRVAKRFLAEVERVAEMLTANPDLGTPTTKLRRVFPLRSFPYSVVYRVVSADIQVLVVRHQHRKPGFGGTRR